MGATKTYKIYIKRAAPNKVGGLYVILNMRGIGVRDCAEKGRNSNRLSKRLCLWIDWYFHKASNITRKKRHPDLVVKMRVRPKITAVFGNHLRLVCSRT